MPEEGLVLPDLLGRSAFLPRTEQPLKRTPCFLFDPELDAGEDSAMNAKLEAVQQDVEIDDSWSVPLSPHSTKPGLAVEAGRQQFFSRTLPVEPDNTVKKPGLLQHSPWSGLEDWRDLDQVTRKVLQDRLDLSQAIAKV